MTPQTLIINVFDNEGRPTDKTRMVTLTTDQIEDIIDRAVQLAIFNNAGNSEEVEKSVNALGDVIDSFKLSDKPPTTIAPSF